MENKIQYRIGMSRELLEFLQETSPADANHFSKLDAFAHIIDWAVGEPVIDNVAECSSDANDADALYPRGSFVTSFSELSSIWNWHRGNVRMFMQSLANLGALKMERVGKKLLVSLSLLLNDDNTPFRLPDDEERGWLRFIMGISSLDEFMSLFDAGMTEAEQALSDSCNHTLGDGCVGIRLRRLLDHLMLHADESRQGSQELHHSLQRLFVKECNSDLLSLLALLSFGGLESISDGGTEVPPLQLSDEAKACLDVITRHYTSWLGKDAVPIVTEQPPALE